MAETSEPRLKLESVILPVFPSSDPVGRVTAAAFSAERQLEISVRGERVIEQRVAVVREKSHEEISKELSLEELLNILKLKMYKEEIADQTVYESLFDVRLEEAWAHQTAARSFLDRIRGWFS